MRPHEIVGFIGFTVVERYVLQSPESRPGIANLGVGADALLAGGRRRLELAPVGLAEPGVLALGPHLPEYGRVNRGGNAIDAGSGKATAH